MTDVKEYLPLQEPTFFILLSLIPGKKHGYAILKEVESLSSGKIRLSTGTLYGAISRLLDQGLIEPTSNGHSNGSGSNGNPGKPRKAYQLTGTGRSVLEAETQRMHHLVTSARGLMDRQQMG